MQKITTSLLLLPMILMAGCAQLKEPEFRRIDNLRVVDASLSSARIGLSASFFNPNNFTVSVKETEADIYLDNVYIGKFAQDSLVETGQNREFSVPISGTVALSKLLDLDLRNLSSRDIEVRAAGQTKVGKAGIYVTRPFEYKGMHRLDDIRF